MDNDISRWVLLLKGVKFFSGFSDEEVAVLLGAGEVRHFQFHDCIIREYDENDDYSFYIILKGSAKVLKSKSHKVKREVIKFHEGECFGEIAFLLREARTADVVAAEECYIFKLSASAVDDIWPDSIRSKIYQKFAVILAERLKASTRDIVNPPVY